MANSKRVLKDLSAMPSQEQLLAMVAALQEQNAQLQANTKQAGVSIIELHGKPFLNFEGPFKSFSFSVQKCQRVVKFYKQIEAFAKSEGKKI